MRIEAVVFDWGGTLSVYEPLELIDLWRIAARHLAPDREEELCAALLGVEAAAWQRTYTTQRSTTLADIIRTASETLGLDVAEAVQEEAGKRHLDSWTPHIRHDPDAAPTLRALRERGLRIGMLSNTHWPREFHERFLARDDLAGLIDARLYTSELDWVKPHPAVFRATLDALDLDRPDQAVFIGDRPHDDIRGARQAGMHTVWRTESDLPAEAVTADATIRRLPELLDLLDAWN